AITGFWTTPELKHALKRGYKLLEIYSVYHYEQRSSELFEEYIRMWLREKQETSGWPFNCTTDAEKEAYIERYKLKEGIQLRSEKISKNPGRGQVAKLMLNFTLGKICSAIQPRPNRNLYRLLKGLRAPVRHEGKLIFPLCGGYLKDEDLWNDFLPDASGSGSTGNGLYRPPQLIALAEKGINDNCLRGFLFKRSSRTQKWRLKWFLLFENLLFYFEHQSDTGAVSQQQQKQTCGGSSNNISNPISSALGSTASNQPHHWVQHDSSGAPYYHHGKHHQFNVGDEQQQQQQQSQSQSQQQQPHSSDGAVFFPCGPGHLGTPTRNVPTNIAKERYVLHASESARTPGKTSTQPGTTTSQATPTASLLSRPVGVIFLEGSYCDRSTGNDATSIVCQKSPQMALLASSINANLSLSATGTPSKQVAASPAHHSQQHQPQQSMMHRDSSSYYPSWQEQPQQQQSTQQQQQNSNHQSTSQHRTRGSSSTGSSNESDFSKSSASHDNSNSSSNNNNINIGGRDKQQATSNPLAWREMSFSIGCLRQESKPGEKAWQGRGDDEGKKERERNMRVIQVAVVSSEHSQSITIYLIMIDAHQDSLQTYNTGFAVIQCEAVRLSPYFAFQENEDEERKKKKKKTRKENQEINKKILLNSTLLEVETISGASEKMASEGERQIKRNSNVSNTCFTITWRREGSKRYEFRAESESECQTWIQAIDGARYSKIVQDKEELEAKHLHLVQIVESESTAKWQYFRQCDELSHEVKRLRAELCAIRRAESRQHQLRLILAKSAVAAAAASKARARAASNNNNNDEQQSSSDNNNNRQSTTTTGVAGQVQKRSRRRHKSTSGRSGGGGGSLSASDNNLTDKLLTNDTNSDNNNNSNNNNHSPGTADDDQSANDDNDNDDDDDRLASDTDSEQLLLQQLHDSAALLSAGIAVTHSDCCLTQAACYYGTCACGTHAHLVGGCGADMAINSACQALSGGGVISANEREAAEQLRKIKKVQGFFRGWLCRRRWKQIVNEYINSPHAECMRKRNHLVFRMVEAEEEYVQLMQLMISAFLRPIKMAASSQRPACTHDEVASIFLNSETVLFLHQIFLKGLMARMESWPTLVLADLFNMLLPMLTIYQEYVRNHHYSLQVLAECKQREQFSALLRRLEDKPIVAGRTLETFLTYPMHQIPRYIICLHEILAHTPHNHVERKSLYEAQTKLEQLSRQMHDEVSETENIRQNLAIERMIIDGCDILLDVNQVFVRQGTLVQIVSTANAHGSSSSGAHGASSGTSSKTKLRSKFSSALQGRNEPKEYVRQCFLFTNHLLLCTRTKDGKLHLVQDVGKIALSEVTLIEDPSDTQLVGAPNHQGSHCQSNTTHQHNNQAGEDGATRNEKRASSASAPTNSHQYHHNDKGHKSSLSLVVSWAAPNTQQSQSSTSNQAQQSQQSNAMQQQHQQNQSHGHANHADYGNCDFKIVFDPKAARDSAPFVHLVAPSVQEKAAWMSDISQMRAMLYMASDNSNNTTCEQTSVTTRANYYLASSVVAVTVALVMAGGVVESPSVDTALLSANICASGVTSGTPSPVESLLSLSQVQMPPIVPLQPMPSPLSPMAQVQIQQQQQQPQQSTQVSAGAHACQCRRRRRRRLGHRRTYRNKRVQFVAPRSASVADPGAGTSSGGRGEYGQQCHRCGGVRVECIDNVHFNDFFQGAMRDSSSVTMSQSVRNDPRLFKDDVDIRFSRALNSCKLPQIRYASKERLFERLTDLRFLSIDFLNTFLLTYRVFTDGVTVLDALKRVHHSAECWVAPATPTALIGPTGPLSGGQCNNNSSHSPMASNNQGGQHSTSNSVVQRWQVSPSVSSRPSIVSSSAIASNTSASAGSNNNLSPQHFLSATDLNAPQRRRSTIASLTPVAGSAASSVPTTPVEQPLSQPHPSPQSMSHRAQQETVHDNNSNSQSHNRELCHEDDIVYETNSMSPIEQQLSHINGGRGTIVAGTSTVGGAVAQPTSVGHGTSTSTTVAEQLLNSPTSGQHWRLRHRKFADAQAAAAAASSGGQPPTNATPTSVSLVAGHNSLSPAAAANKTINDYYQRRASAAPTLSLTLCPIECDALTSTNTTSSTRDTGHNNANNDNNKIAAHSAATAQPVNSDALHVYPRQRTPATNEHQLNVDDEWPDQPEVAKAPPSTPTPESAAQLGATQSSVEQVNESNELTLTLHHTLMNTGDDNDELDDGDQTSADDDSLVASSSTSSISSSDSSASSSASSSSSSSSPTFEPLKDDEHALTKTTTTAGALKPHSHSQRQATSSSKRQASDNYTKAKVKTTETSTAANKASKVLDRESSTTSGDDDHHDDDDDEQLMVIIDESVVVKKDNYVVPSERARHKRARHRHRRSHHRALIDGLGCGEVVDGTTGSAPDTPGHEHGGIGTTTTTTTTTTRLKGSQKQNNSSNTQNGALKTSSVAFDLSPLSATPSEYTVHTNMVGIGADADTETCTPSGRESKQVDSRQTTCGSPKVNAAASSAHGKRPSSGCSVKRHSADTAWSPSAAAAAAAATGAVIGDKPRASSSVALASGMSASSSRMSTPRTSVTRALAHESPSAALTGVGSQGAPGVGTSVGVGVVVSSSTPRTSSRRSSSASAASAFAAATAAASNPTLGPYAATSGATPNTMGGAMVGVDCGGALVGGQCCATGCVNCRRAVSPLQSRASSRFSSSAGLGTDGGWPPLGTPPPPAHLTGGVHAIGVGVSVGGARHAHRHSSASMAMGGMAAAAGRMHTPTTNASSASTSCVGLNHHHHQQQQHQGMAASATSLVQAPPGGNTMGSQVTASAATSTCVSAGAQQLRSAATIRVLSVLRHWVSKHAQDFESDPQLAHETHEFLAELIADPSLLPAEHKAAVQLQQLVAKAPYARHERVDLDLLLATPARASPDTIETLSALELAETMTYLDHKIFLSIRAGEFLGQAWMKEDKALKAPHILLITKRFNDMSRLVSSEIIRVGELSRRVAIIEKWTNVAHICRVVHNFNGVLQICAAFENSSIFRLRKTWEKVAKTTRTTIDQLQGLVSTDSRFRNMRDAISRCDPPCIPYVGMYLSDLSFIEEGTPDFSPEGLLNFSKMRMMAHVIREIQHLQNGTYKIEFNPKVAHYLLDTSRHLSDNEMYRMSLSIEPRLSTPGGLSRHRHLPVIPYSVVNQQQQHQQQQHQQQPHLSVSPSKSPL
ncbi:Ras-specific guanine nucleotide-releasing factor 2, partial [Fragariocoptes setiger]